MASETPARYAAEAPAASTTREEDVGWKEALWRRRQYVVGARYQFRVTGFTVALVAALLVMLNLVFYLSSLRIDSVAVASAPELKSYFRAQDQFQFSLMLLGSMVFLGGVFVLGVLETHRTAGAAYAISRAIEKIRRGKYTTRLRLRRSDNLHDIEAALNGMAQALRERTDAEAEALLEMASRAEHVTDDPRIQAIAQRLRALAEEKRRLLE